MGQLNARHVRPRGDNVPVWGRKLDFMSFIHGALSQ